MEVKFEIYAKIRVLTKTFGSRSFNRVVLRLNQEFSTLEVPNSVPPCQSESQIRNLPKLLSAYEKLWVKIVQYGGFTAKSGIPYPISAEFRTHMPKWRSNSKSTGKWSAYGKIWVHIVQSGGFRGVFFVLFLAYSGSCMRPAAKKHTEHERGSFGVPLNTRGGLTRTPHSKTYTEHERVQL